MNTIIWIGLFMFIMGTIILVSSYQSIFNQSAKAAGIILDFLKIGCIL